LIWTDEQDKVLVEAVKLHKGKNWKSVAEVVGFGRSNIQCKHRWQKVLDPVLVKGPWSAEEDGEIANLVSQYGPKRWSFIAKHLQGRTGKQCRERWVNQLDPTIKKDPWDEKEDEILQNAHASLGNKWAEIAKLLSGRSENAVKNRWHGSLRRNMVFLANKATTWVRDQKATTPSESADEHRPPPTSSPVFGAGDGPTNQARPAGYWLFMPKGVTGSGGDGGGDAERSSTIVEAPEALIPVAMTKPTRRTIAASAKPPTLDNSSTV
jgi:hypothetical protein